MHRGLRISEEQRQRFVELYSTRLSVEGAATPARGEVPAAYNALCRAAGTSPRQPPA